MVLKKTANWCFKFKTSELVGACFKNVRGRIIWKYPENIDLYNHWFASGKTEEEESAFEVHVPKWQDCVVSQNFAPQSPYCSQSRSFFTTPIVPKCCTAGSVSHNLQTCNFSSAASYQPMCCEQYGSHQYQGNVTPYCSCFQQVHYESFKMISKYLTFIILNSTICFLFLI